MSLRVLHLPDNIASLPSHSVKGLRQFGVNAHGLIYSGSQIQTDNGLRIINQNNIGVVRKIMNRLRWLRFYLPEILASDILHWYFHTTFFPLNFDLLLLRMLKKPGIVEWHGSDIRNPEVEFKDNPYYTKAFFNGYEYASLESELKSKIRQRKFANAKFASGSSKGMMQYINKKIFPFSYHMPKRLVVSDFEPQYPSISKKRPLVIHSPSAPIAKGTETVIKTIQHLKKYYKFDFQLIQGLSRNKAMTYFKSADIILDQFVLGDYGMVALEAMAFGKPVICYIKPSLAALYGDDLPIIKATQESLEFEIANLLSSPRSRNEFGISGRNYVEKYHSMDVVAPILLNIYQDVIKKY